MSKTAGFETATNTESAHDATSGAVERVRAGLVSGRGWQGIDVASLARQDLISTHRDLARMRREIDAMLAYSSAEIARRSTPDDGQEGLAKREGFRTPEEFVASISGGSTREAHRLIEVGDALAREENYERTRVEMAGEGGGVDGAEGSRQSEVVHLSPRLAIVRDRVRAGKEGVSLTV